MSTTIRTLDNELVTLFTDAINQVSAKRVATVRAEQSISELGLDSIAVMEMVGTLEDKLAMHFSDDELTRINTFADLATLVEKHRRKVA